MVKIRPARRSVQPEPELAPGTDTLESVEEVLPPGLEHVGGGWYELPDGTKIQGRQAAEDAVREQQSSDVSEDA